MAKNNRYEYETSPRKLEPYYAPKKKTNVKKKSTDKAKSIKKQKEERKAQLKTIKWVAIVFTILFAISYRNAQIDEHFDKVQTLKSELSALDKENTQLEVSIESTLNLTNLEQQAKNILGMQKLTNKQTEYVTLPKTDYIEIAPEQVELNEQKNIFQKIGSWITNVFK